MGIEALSEQPVAKEQLCWASWDLRLGRFEADSRVGYSAYGMEAIEAVEAMEAMVEVHIRKHGRMTVTPWPSLDADSCLASYASERRGRNACEQHSIRRIRS